MAPIFRSGISWFGDKAGMLLFPTTCPSCGRFLVTRQGWPVCAECERLIEELTEPLCPRCGRSVVEEGLCEICLEDRTPEPFFPIRSMAHYAGPLREMILAIKNGEREDIAPILGTRLELLCRPLLQPGERATVVPVPLYRTRMLQRGFNLPDILAHRLAKAIHGQYRPGWLRRIRDTPSQKGRGVQQRLENVKGAFAAAESLSIEGKLIFLVDDVATSGATLAMAAKPLLKEGARVVGVTLARA